eukprot:gene25050-10699_t
MKKAQGYAYTRCIEEFGDDHTFIGFIDVDEFLTIEDEKATSINNGLKEFKDYGGFSVHLRIIGPSGHQEFNRLQLDPGKSPTPCTLHPSSPHCRPQAPTTSCRSSKTMGATSINDVLKEFEDYGGVSFHWRIIGPSGHQNSPTTPVVDSYTDCLPRGFHFHRQIKSFINTNVHKDSPTTLVVDSYTDCLPRGFHYHRQI